MSIDRADPRHTAPSHQPTARPLLDVHDLTTTVRVRHGQFNPVDHVSFFVAPGETLAIVGESGSGKTMTALSVMQLLPPAASITDGTLRLEDRDLRRLSEREMRRMRGDEIAMVFQEPMTSLDPAFTIGSQITETVHAHRSTSKAAARDLAIEMLERVGISNAARRVDDYPYQFSGGMRQRVMLAMALVLEPKLLIADEPTTALDVTTQAQFLDLVMRLHDELHMAVLLITHDLGVVNEIADRVAVMYAGELVESGTVQEIFNHPQHPYTQGLLRSMPGLADRTRRLPSIPGRVVELSALPPACRFAPRCENRIERCMETHPTMEGDAGGRELRCFNPSPF